MMDTVTNFTADKSAESNFLRELKHRGFRSPEKYRKTVTLYHDSYQSYGAGFGPAPTPSTNKWLATTYLVGASNPRLSCYHGT